MPTLFLASPAFVVADVDATMRWYQDVLGFEAYPVPERPPSVFAIVARDTVQIMLQLIAGYEKPDLRPLRPAGVWDAYIRLAGIRELYEALRDTPWLHQPLTRREYGHTEFEVRDPNGYVLVFSEATDTPEE